ncbi:MAG: P-loop NTPase [Verrucomicrobia bacterium]|nr:P-loop NTPase [Verrucomicrobiota bacterium]
MSREEEVLASMRGIIDPDLGKDIVTLGFIKHLKIADDGKVAFMVELTTPACPVKEQFRDSCTQAVSALPWVTAVDVKMGAQPGRGALAQSGPGLAAVKHVVAVASCKGGVGKSTVAVNLAYALAAQGAQVGIFDADIYGPSLPTMVKAPFDGLFQAGSGLILPVTHAGLKLMSFAYANPKPGAPAVMRGPMVTSVVNQLLTTTDWGALDYLIIDMPPGTGDIQLTLSQIIPITAAVIVTTPQEISFIDVVKGIKMFDLMKIPTVAVVENMSYFVCDGCDKRHRLFGAGAMRRLVEQFGIRNAIELALDPAVAAHSDGGTPIMAAQPDHPVSRGYLELAGAVAREISKLLHADAPKPMVRYNGREVLFAPGDGKEFRLNPAGLRRSCRCASCINEMTGKKTLNDAEIPETVAPSQIGAVGNYAATIAWSDGHSSIYPFDMLSKLVAEGAV